MAYQTIQDFNATGLDDVLFYVVQEVPFFGIIFLISIYLTVGLSVYFGSRKFTGNADLFASFSVAGFLTFIIGLFLSLSGGVINPFILTITLTLAIVPVIGLLTRRNRD